MRVLIVEDNERLAGLLRQALAAAGFATETAGTVEDARLEHEGGHFDAIVLDLGLPDEDGLVLLREIRVRKQAIPVLILTARGRLTDRVTGLDAGADDFLVKPFAVEELVARVRAMTRRQGEMLGGEVDFCDVRLDLVSRQAFVREKPLLLSGREVDLLERLMRRAGRVVPRTVLEGDLVNLGDDAGSNLIEVYVHRLRRKLADAGTLATIHTVRGVGYMLGEGR